MKVKNERTVGVIFHHSMLHGLEVVDRTWRKVTGTHARVTGLGEEGHSEGSLHYGVSGDIRTRAFDVDADDPPLTLQMRSEILRELRIRLPRGSLM